MYSLKIVGWHLSESLSNEGTVSALKKALRADSLIDKLIHHSDRGIQYCSKEYRKEQNRNQHDGGESLLRKCADEAGQWHSQR